MEAAIRISKKDWEFLQDEASKFNKASDMFLVFACFSKRRTHWDILEVRKLPIELIKVGSGFTYIYPGIKKLGFYPERNSSKRFCGTFVMGDDVKLEFEDAYWMGWERIDFRIKMDRDDAGKLRYRAYGIEHNSRQFGEVAVEIV